jgi:hypothetical protein
VAVVESRSACIARGLRIKRTNAAAAILTGGLMTAGSVFLYDRSFSFLRLLLGILLGILYANAFEYVLHRFVLHWGEGFLVQRHALHHNSSGAADEALYVNFATSPWVVVLVFVLNAPSVIAMEGLFHQGSAPGMFAGFTLYYVSYEEIHWRIHFGGRLPGWLRFARRHHLLHHGDHKGRYNVFLPIFDWIFERDEWNRTAAPIERRS